VQIILVSDRLATARSITLSKKHLAVVAVLGVAALLALSSLLSWLTLRHAAELRIPFLQDMLAWQRAEETERTQQFVQENLNTMAVRLGQMQAQLIQLDLLGTRVATLAGLKPQDIKTVEKPGQGGPLVGPVQPLSAEELAHQLDLLARQVDFRSDYLGLMESNLLEERTRLNLLPSSLPIQAAWNSSSYGWRIDPFNGARAFHEGVDFVAPKGTAIAAAAAGVVVKAEFHPQYGNMVEIDHGNDLTTRYAHASRLLVGVGTVVKRGQIIAAVGSTGRSTGPHLHFEVRVRGAAQNPSRFLARAQAEHLAAR
jgi:murein DD-endopeptidase MepM/ murein hydrolase activator NlpD